MTTEVLFVKYNDWFFNHFHKSHYYYSTKTCAQWQVGVGSCWWERFSEYLNFSFKQRVKFHLLWKHTISLRILNIRLSDCEKNTETFRTIQLTKVEKFFITYIKLSFDKKESRLCDWDIIHGIFHFFFVKKFRQNSIQERK